MRKFKTKLASMLVALTCVFACLGVGVFAINNRLEAKAAAKEIKPNRFTISTRRPSKGYGNGCSQLIALLLGIILLLIAGVPSN